MSTLETAFWTDLVLPLEEAADLHDCGSLSLEEAKNRALAAGVAMQLWCSRQTSADMTFQQRLDAMEKLLLSCRVRGPDDPWLQLRVQAITGLRMSMQQDH